AGEDRPERRAGRADPLPRVPLGQRPRPAVRVQEVPPPRPLQARRRARGPVGERRCPVTASAACLVTAWTLAGWVVANAARPGRKARCPECGGPTVLWGGEPV